MCFDCQDRKKYDVSIRPCIHHVTVAERMQGVPDVLIRNTNVKFFHRHLETLPNCLRYLAVVDSWKICRERYWGGLLIIFYINSTLSLLLMSGLITASPSHPHQRKVMLVAWSQHLVLSMTSQILWPKVRDWITERMVDWTHMLVARLSLH